MALRLVTVLAGLVLLWDALVWPATAPPRKAIFEARSSEPESELATAMPDPSAAELLLILLGLGAKPPDGPSPAEYERCNERAAAAAAGDARPGARARGSTETSHAVPPAVITTSPPFSDRELPAHAAPAQRDDPAFRTAYLACLRAERF